MKRDESISKLSVASVHVDLIFVDNSNLSKKRSVRKNVEC